jgi:hypothetical protein
MSQKVFLISPEAPLHQFAGPGEQRQIKEGGIRLGTLDNTKGNADHLLAFVMDGMRKLLPAHFSSWARRRRAPSACLSCRC